MTHPMINWTTQKRIEVELCNGNSFIHYEVPVGNTDEEKLKWRPEPLPLRLYKTAESQREPSCSMCHHNMCDHWDELTNHPKQPRLCLRAEFRHPDRDWYAFTEAMWKSFQANIHYDPARCQVCGDDIGDKKEAYENFNSFFNRTYYCCDDDISACGFSKRDSDKYKALYPMKRQLYKEQ